MASQGGRRRHQSEWRRRWRCGGRNPAAGSVGAGAPGSVPAGVSGTTAKKRRSVKKDAEATEAGAAESKKEGVEPAKPAETEEPIDITSRPPSLRQPPKKN